MTSGERQREFVFYFSCDITAKSFCVCGSAGSWSALLTSALSCYSVVWLKRVLSQVAWSWPLDPTALLSLVVVEKRGVSCDSHHLKTWSGCHQSRNHLNRGDTKRRHREYSSRVRSTLKARVSLFFFYFGKLNFRIQDHFIATQTFFLMQLCNC